MRTGRKLEVNGGATGLLAVVGAGLKAGRPRCRVAFHWIQFKGELE
jgi:hypothetical protein